MIIWDKIKRLIGTRELQKRLKNDEPLAMVFIRLWDATNNLNFIEGNALCSEPFLPHLLQATEQYKNDFAKNLNSEIMLIANSNNRVLACRNWIISLVDEYAPVTTVLISKHNDDHPCLKEGLFDYADQIILNSFYELYDEIGDITKCKEHLNLESIKLHFKLAVANHFRIELGDYKEGSGDWYRKYISSAIANTDMNYRSALGIDLFCSAPEIIIEHTSIRNNLLNGYKDPLESVQFV